MAKNFLIFILIVFFVHDLYAQHAQDKISSKPEDKIIDTISKLEEVVERAKFVKDQTKGKRHLQVVIWDRPKKATPYYWVKVTEDNRLTFYTHFNFYVYPKTITIKYLDTITDKLIDLATWRKDQKRLTHKAPRISAKLH